MRLSYEDLKREAYPDRAAIAREVFPDWRAVYQESRIPVPEVPGPEAPRMTDLAFRVMQNEIARELATRKHEER